MKIIKRILNYKKQDWQHIRGLLKNLLKGMVTMNYYLVQDSWGWLKFHIICDSMLCDDEMMEEYLKNKND
jgi:hypothetical protein